MPTNATILPPNWRPDIWHGAPLGVQWRVTPRGILLNGQEHPQLSAIPEIRALPLQCWRLFNNEVNSLANIFQVSRPLLLATIASESGGNVNAMRDEGFDRSYGLAQTLTGTADFIGRWLGWPRGEGPFLMPMQARTEYHQWEKFLSAPWTSIALCAALHSYNNSRLNLQGDPMLLYAAYNAGGVYESNGDHYRIRNATPALDAFRLMFNGAVRAMHT